MIQAVVFDVDDTIYDQQEPFRRSIHQLFPLVIEEDMAPLYIRFRHHSDTTFEKTITGEWTLAYMRCFRIKASLSDLDYPDITDEAALAFQQVYEQALDEIVMHPEVERTLDYLKVQNIPLGLITNGPTDHQYKKIKQLNLEKWVPSERIIISQAAGYQKPDPRIFELAENLFNFEPTTTLYVGDSFENDVVGAKSRDWHALWFNHRERQLPTDAQALHDVELSSFCQLPATIEALF